MRGHGERGRGGRHEPGFGGVGRRHGIQPGRVSGFLEPALLLLLHRGTSHGYELAEGLAGLDPGLSGFDMSTVYRILRSMEDQGYVVSEWDTGSHGPARRVYSLTPGGDRCLALWIEDLRSTSTALSRFLDEYEHHMRLHRTEAEGPHGAPGH